MTERYAFADGCRRPRHRKRNSTIERAVHNAADGLTLTGGNVAISPTNFQLRPGAVKGYTSRIPRVKLMRLHVLIIWLCVILVKL